MTTSHINPRAELKAFEARNTPEGLFVRYARARTRDFRSRQVLIIGGSLALAWLVSPFFGFWMAVLVLFGEVLDCVSLSLLAKKGVPPRNLQRALKISTVTATLQGATLGITVWLTWSSLADGATHFFAMVFLADASINAGLVWVFHRSASIARLGIYGFVAVWLSFEGLVRAHGGHLAWLDTFATAMLAYISIMFVNYSVASFHRRRVNDQKVLPQKQKLTEMHAAMAAKEQHARNLALVAQSANDCVIITGPDRKIEWVNPAFSKITGYGSEEVLGRDTADLLNGSETDPTTIKEIANAVAALKPIRTEIRNHTKSSETVWVETDITPIASEAGTLSKVISVERDITKIKEREKELALAKVAAEEGARTKANFLATMSHEIRTPLNGIIGMADLLNKTELGVEQKKYVDIILNSGEALLRIINDILDLSKLDTGGVKTILEPFSITHCLRESVELLAPLARKKGLKMATEFPPDVPDTFVGGVGHIRQIVINLIGNAIKFTSEGEVKIALGVRKKSNDFEVEIEVSDTGIGICEEAQSRIFEEFSQAEEDTTRNFGGTGLGLTISQKFAKEMGGDISVQSVLGIGSQFCLRLMLSASKFTENDKLQKCEQYKGHSDLKNKRILITEDNRINQLLIRKMLEGHVDSLRFAKDGLEAVEKYSEYKPELVLMDISMPKQNCPQATKEIRLMERNSGDRSVIIALTANAFSSDREKCLEAGMDGFLTKPVKIKELLQSVNFYLAER